MIGYRSRDGSVIPTIDRPETPQKPPTKPQPPTTMTAAVTAEDEEISALAA
ncbi:MAG: hypothetical protein ACNA7M_07580 [Roseovarius sp.]